MLGLAGFVYAAVQSAVLPALPSFQHSLHTSVDGAGWILITYLLSASVATPIIGRLGDMYGKDRLLVVDARRAVAAGTLLAALSNSIALLDLARVIQGVGGGVVPLSFGIVRDEIPRARVATSIGIVSSMLGIGGGAGIVLGALILEHLSWQWLFWAAARPDRARRACSPGASIPPSPVRTPGPDQLDRGGADERRHVGGADRRQRGRDLGMGLAEDARPARRRASPSAPAGSPGRCAARDAARRHAADAAARRCGPRTSRPRCSAAACTRMFLIVPEFVQEPRSTGYGLGAVDPPVRPLPAAARGRRCWS